MEDRAAKELSLLRTFVRKYRRGKELDFERIFALAEGGDRAEGWYQEKNSVEQELYRLNVELERMEVRV